GSVALVNVRYDLEPDEVSDQGALLEETLREALEPAGIGVEMRGVIIDAAAQPAVPVGELIGVALAVVLLTLLFRSLAAMVATLVGALIGVGVGQLLLQLVSTPLGLPEFAGTIA